MTTRRKAGVVVVAVALTVLAGCSTAPSVIAGSSTAAPQEQLVWVGTGTSWVFEDGEWFRTPEQDYQFLVRQNRYAGRWESLKVQNRTHPRYDGTAGPADQQHFFAITFGDADSDGQIATELASTYGDGGGWTDEAYRHAVLEFEAEGVSRFAPYDRFRITQEYRYEEGELRETVELYKVDSDGREHPFARIEEEARMFHPGE
ncbi:MAG: hypothetical protein ACOCSK_02205 [Rhodothermales bacterium]